jgi:hypothetical protein
LTPFDRQVKDVALRFYEGLATPVALKAAVMLRNDAYDDLASCKVHPRHYLCAESYWRDASAISLLRKLRELPTTHDRRAVAERGFLANEEECLRTNRRLYPYLTPRLYEECDEGVVDFINRTRKIIAGILGKVPADFEGRFGPGATFGDRGRLTTVPDKMSSRPTLTSDAKWHLLPWGQTLWAKACNESGRDVTFVQGNRFTTVPKDCEKDRGIAIEPSINVFYQLGVGRAIRRRLKVAGIDLLYGQDIHRQVACEASIKGHLATLDLSNASDTISRNLVKLLLPADWFEVLDDLRSKKTNFRGNWHVLEKFSSMGNGFTFELETLLFLGLVLACDRSNTLVAGEDVFVFGDDIICPTEISRDVISALKFFGMTINEGKSFVEGPFRESCGGDYFLGVDVRPFFLKESPNEPQQLISFANGIRRASKASPDRSHRVRSAWFRILDALPNAIRDIRGPEDLGDLVIHDEESRWRFRWRRNGIRYFRAYRPARYRKVPWGNFKPEVTLATAVYGLSSGGELKSIREGGQKREAWDHTGVTPRDAVIGYKIGWVPRS